MQSIEMETKEGQALKLPQFRWGVRRGVGTKGKNVRFYESFSYNGTDYSRYDCVTVYKKGEQEPYIAKITKIWEDLDDTTKPRKIKLHWFFRPAELYNAAVDFKPIASPNEIFIASGTGKGVANINPIETILKKCIVLCTSKGEQNPQPTQEDLDNADYFYYRTFNVDTYCISERLTELEEDLVFNKKSWVRKGSSFVKHASFMSEERFTNCRSSKRHVLQEHERKNDVEEASKKIIKSETSSRVVKSQPSGGHFDNTIGGTVRRELGSLLVPNIEGQEDESQINVSVRKPTNDYIASENARKELKMDEQSDMMVKKQTTTPYGCVDGVNAEAQSIELQLSCERKKTIVNEMASKPPEKVDDISEDNTIEDSFQGTTVQMLKSSNSTECSVHYELVNLVNSMNDKLQRLEKQFEHMKKRLDRIDKQVWKSRNAKFSTKVIDTAKVNQPKNGTKKRKFGKIREQIPKESFPTDEKNVELREDASLNKRSGSKWGCYICKGAHYARMCPLR